MRQKDTYRKPIPVGKNPSVSTHQFRVESPALKHNENGFHQTTLFNSSFWSPALLQISALLSWLFLVCLFNNFNKKIQKQSQIYRKVASIVQRVFFFLESFESKLLTWFSIIPEYFSFCKEYSPTLSQCSHQNQEVKGDNISII